MTVGDLRKIINKIPDDILIVTHGYDHSYIEANVRETTALKDGQNLTEDYGEELTPEKVHGKRISVLLID